MFKRVCALYGVADARVTDRTFIYRFAMGAVDAMGT